MAAALTLSKERMRDLRVTPLEFMVMPDARQGRRRGAAPSSRTLRDLGFLGEPRSLSGADVVAPKLDPALKPALKPRPRRANDALKKCIFIPPMDELLQFKHLPRPVALAPAAQKAPRKAAPPAEPSTWEDPLVVGTLLTVLPPAGLLLLWSSDRYSRDARVAVTLMSTFFMILCTAVAFAVLLR